MSLKLPNPPHNLKFWLFNLLHEKHTFTNFTRPIHINPNIRMMFGEFMP